MYLIANQNNPPVFLFQLITGHDQKQTHQETKLQALPVTRQPHVPAHGCGCAARCVRGHWGSPRKPRRHPTVKPLHPWVKAGSSLKWNSHGVWRKILSTTKLKYLSPCQTERENYPETVKPMMGAFSTSSSRIYDNTGPARRKTKDLVVSRTSKAFCFFSYWELRSQALCRTAAMMWASGQLLATFGLALSKAFCSRCH